jgi:hypothetical protein
VAGWQNQESSIGLSTSTAHQQHITHVESSTTRVPLPTEMAPPNCVTTLRLKVEPLMVVSVLLSSSTDAPSPMLLPAVSVSQVLVSPCRHSSAVNRVSIGGLQRLVPVKVDPVTFRVALTTATADSAPISRLVTDDRSSVSCSASVVQF